MQKKFIIAAVITAFLWGGFMFYRHNKQGEDQVKHREKLNSQLTEMAKKSPRAGMAHVGEALSAYYKDKNEYPSKLLDLYPDYLDNKSLLTQIDWYYEPQGNDFFLSKTLVLRNKRMVATMDASLRPKSEKGVMVAAPTPPTTDQETTTEDFQKEKVHISDEKKLAMARENFLNALREGRYSVSEVYEPGKDESQLLSRVIPRYVSVSGKPGESSPEMELGQQFLVWKSDKGSLGFGNTQYPDADDLSIFTYGRWYHVSIPEKPAVEKKTAESEQKEQHWANMVVANLEIGDIGWKDKKGTYGFGNTQYPKESQLSVFETDEWVELPHRPLPPDKGPEDSKDREQKTRRTTEQIASGMGKHWLVWKDKSGTYGFGDHQYPEKHAASIFHDDGWVTYEKQTVSSDAKREDPDESHATATSDDLAARFGEHLVWKNKNGTMGFGNLQYPEEELASVYQSDEWVEAKELQRPQKPIHSSKQEQKGQTASKETGSLLNGPYLVWKTAHGTLGFGNNQYPKGSGVSHIHIDGSWEPVAY